MANPGPEEPVMEFVDRYLTYLSDGGDEPNLAELPEVLQRAALLELRALDAFEPMGYASPPIEDDPIARRFGFGRDEPTTTISTAALKTALNDASVKTSELAHRLTAGGRPTETKELMRLLVPETVSVDRDLAARFAAILDASVSDLEVASGSGSTRSLDDFLVLEEVKQLVERCALELGDSFESIQGQVRHLMASSAFRNRTDEAWTEALRAALERVRGEFG